MPLEIIEWDMLSKVLIYWLPILEVYLWICLSIDTKTPRDCTSITSTYWRSKTVERKVPFHGILIFFETSRFRLNIDELSSRVLQNCWNPGWLSKNTVAIETKFHGKITIQLADFVESDWFSAVFCGRNLCSNSRIRQ